MAGYERIYLFGGVGGYMGADGMSPIAMQMKLSIRHYYYLFAY